MTTECNEVVRPGFFPRAALTNLRDSIKDLIYEYEGRASLAEVVGILEIVKAELIEEHQ